MAVMTIRDLDDEVRDRLRVRAAQNGRSMEAEVRAILANAVDSPVTQTFAEALLKLTEAVQASGYALEPLPKEYGRDPFA